MFIELLLICDISGSQASQKNNVDVLILRTQFLIELVTGLRGASILSIITYYSKYHPFECCNVGKVMKVAITFALLFVTVASVSCIFILLSDLP